MYTELFEKMGFNRGSLWSYKGSNLQTFNGTTTFPGRYMVLMVFVADGNDIRAVSSQFLVITYKSVYNYTLGIPFAFMRDVLASLEHLNMNHHNLYGELTIISADLEDAKIIYQSLYKD